MNIYLQAACSPRAAKVFWEAPTPDKINGNATKTNVTYKIGTAIGKIRRKQGHQKETTAATRQSEFGYHKYNMYKTTKSASLIPRTLLLR